VHPLPFLTLDLGSSELKFAVYDLDGSCLSSATTELIGARIQGSRAELDAELFWQTTCKGISAVCRDLRVPFEAAAISSHGESFVPLDEQGNAVGNILLNIDSRADSEMNEFTAAFTKLSIYQQTGLPAHPMYTLPKIAWLRKNRPDIFDRSARFVCLEDYILARLQLEPVISSPLASRTMGLDIRGNAWSERFLQFAGISSSKLSRVARSGTAVGIAAPQIAGRMGLPPGVVWCTGGHDQVCASLGAGVQGVGTLADGTGTFECVSALLDAPLLSEASLGANLPCERHAIPDKFLTLAYIPGGIALKWLRDSWNAESGEQSVTGQSAYDRMLENIPTEPTGLFFFPYLLGTGTPWLSEAPATIWGLNSRTTRHDLAKAAIEGVSYEMRWNLEIFKQIGIRMDRILAVGGGAKSDKWLQLKADIFECPVAAVPGEASSRGAAICAAMGVKCFDNWNEAISAMVRPGRVFEPRPAMQDRYRELFEHYKELAGRIYDHPFPMPGADFKSGVHV
jgi:xylulokinase